MRRLLKFLHTMGATGLIGAVLCLIVLLIAAPPPTDLKSYALAYRGMAAIATWILLPSLVLTVLSGVFSIAVTPAFHEAGWAWVKLATGVTLLEGGLVYIQGPIKAEAERSAAALAGGLDPSALAESAGAQQGTLWVLFAVATANVVLGVWRPRLTRRPGKP